MADFASGFTAGGNLFNQAESRRLQGRSLDQKQRALEVKQRQVQQKQVLGQAGEFLKTLELVAEKNPDRARQLVTSPGVAQAVTGFEGMLGQAGVDAAVIQGFRTRVGLIGQAAQTSQEKGAARKAEAKAAGSTVEGSRERAELTGTLRTFRLPDGSFRSVRATSPDIDTLIKAGAIEVPLKVQATTTADLGTPTTKDISESKTIILETTGNIRDLANNLKVLERTQGASGLRGSIAETGAGLLSQIPGVGSSLGEAFSQSVAGASQKDVTDVRTRSRFMVSRMLRTITNETSGRYTDRERAIAEEALKTLSPEAGFEQIRAALKVAMEADIFSRERAKIRAGVSTAFMSNNIEEIIRETRRFIKNGFTRAEAIAISVRLAEEAKEFTEQLGVNKP